jgi:hypothetical protein
MFAKKTADKSTAQPDTPDTVRALAAAVPLTAQHQLAENSLAALRQQLDTLGAEQSALIRENHRDPDPVLSRQIRAAEPRIAELRSQIVDGRQRIAAFRMQRARQVADMLVPLRRQVASRVLELLDEVDRLTDTLISCNDELRQAGDPNSVFLNHVPCVTLRDHARRLLTS